MNCHTEYCPCDMHGGSEYRQPVEFCAETQHVHRTSTRREHIARTRSISAAKSTCPAAGRLSDPESDQRQAQIKANLEGVGYGI